LPNPFRVKTLRLSNGERLPLILDTRTGKPLFGPLSYSLHHLRARGYAANTIKQFCQAASLLEYFLETSSIDIPGRLERGLILEEAELSNLIRRFHLKADDFEIACSLSPKDKPSINRPLTLEKVRKLPSKRVQDSVASITLAIRLHYTREYLVSQATTHALRQATPQGIRSLLHESSELLKKRIGANMPSTANASDTPPPEGLTNAQVDLLLSIARPDSENNPWKDEFVRSRNYVILLCLLSFGVRGGELLRLKTSDFNPSSGTICITRGADDVDDPRRNQPNTKTTARELGVSQELSSLLLTYITNDRRKAPGARRHPFLFVSKNGAPLSLNSLYKIFTTLRSKCPELTSSLTAHLLRYTCTDDILLQFEASEMSPEQQAHELRYLLGWSEKSKMPEKYGRRHIAKQANEVLTQRQKKVFRRKLNEN